MAPGIYCICLCVSTWDYELEILISNHDSPLNPWCLKLKKGRNCKWLEKNIFAKEMQLIQCGGEKKRLCSCMCVNVHCMNVSEWKTVQALFSATTHGATAWLRQSQKLFKSLSLKSKNKTKRKSKTSILWFWIFFFYISLKSIRFISIYIYIFIYIPIKYITGATRKCSQTQNCVWNQSNKMQHSKYIYIGEVGRANRVEGLY